MAAAQPILVLTGSAGVGHITAAHAVATALRQAAPQESVEVHDILAYAGAVFRRVYGQGYDDLVRLLPGAWGWFYYTTDRPAAHPGHRLLRTVQNLFIAPIIDHLVRMRPKLIVNTHFLAAEVVAIALRRGQLCCPQATAVTDFEGHRLWQQDPTQRYYVATQRAKAYLVCCGAKPESVQVTGIPVRAGFAAALEPHEARRQLGLRPDRPVVLLLGSAGGVGRAVGFLQQLIDLPIEVQIVAIAGRFERLQRRLDLLSRGARQSVRVVGFTGEMHVWMRAADLVITKPGGLTVAEALASHVPLVIVNPLAGQELCNSDYVLAHGAAVKVNKPELLAYEVEQLLSAPDRLEAMRSAARALARPHAAREIATDALALLRT